MSSSEHCSDASRLAKSRSGAKFRRIRTKDTFTKYKQSAIRYIGLVIRYMLWLKFRKTGGIGSFKPKLTQAMLEEFKVIYGLLSQGAEVDTGSLVATAHRILFHTFTTSMNARQPVDSALEQSLIFSMLTPHAEQWLSAACLTRLCSQVQRIIFSTIFHTAWMGGIDGTFTLSCPLDDNALSANTESATDDDDSQSDDPMTEVQAHTEMEDREADAEFEKFDGVEADFDEWGARSFDVAGTSCADGNDPCSEAQDSGMEILHGRDLCEDPLLK